MQRLGLAQAPPGRLPAGSASSSSVGPPGAGEGARRLPVRSARAPRSPQRRGPARARLRGAQGGPASFRSPLAAGPGVAGKPSRRWAAAREEDATHSWLRRRLLSAGCPKDPEVRTDAKALYGQPCRLRWGAGASGRQPPSQSHRGAAPASPVHCGAAGRVSATSCASVALRVNWNKYLLSQVEGRIELVHLKGLERAWGVESAR